MDSIAQIKAIYSSLIEGIIPKAEEILEKIGMLSHLFYVRGVAFLSNLLFVYVFV